MVSDKIEKIEKLEANNWMHYVQNKNIHVHSAEGNTMNT